MGNYAQQVKEKLLESIQSLESLKRLFVLHPDKDFTRQRELSFETMLKIILEMEGGTLAHELRHYFSFSVDMPTVSAFVQRRSLISPDAFLYLFHSFNFAIPFEKLFEGYRLIACDGTDLNISRNPEDSENYFQSNPGEKGFNLLHLNALYDLCNKRYLDALIQPGRKKNEFQAICQMADRFPYSGKTIFIADRGYECYNVFAHIERKGLNYLIRIKDKDSNGILGAIHFHDTDTFDIDIHKCLTRKQTKEVKAHPEKYHFLPKNSPFDFLDLHTNLYYDMDFRAVRLKISDDSYECIITNLDRKAFPPEKIKELYHMRWGIETSFRDLKHTIGLNHFHSKKVEFIKQEIFARLVLYNFCEAIASHVVVRNKPRKHTYQLNFSAAVDICRQFLRDRSILSPPDVEALLLKYVQPVRYGRHDPRKVKPRSFVSFTYRVA